MVGLENSIPSTLHGAIVNTLRYKPTGLGSSTTMYINRCVLILFLNASFAAGPDMFYTYYIPYSINITSVDPFNLFEYISH